MDTVRIWIIPEAVDHILHVRLRDLQQSGADYLRRDGLFVDIDGCRTFAFHDIAEQLKKALVKIVIRVFPHMPVITGVLPEKAAIRGIVFSLWQVRSGTWKGF